MPYNNLIFIEMLQKGVISILIFSFHFLLKEAEYFVIVIKVLLEVKYDFLQRYASWRGDIIRFFKNR